MMAFSKTSPNQVGGIPTYRKLHRVFFAVCIVLAPLSMSLWFALCPEYGNPACPEGTSATLIAFRAANPALIQLFFAIAFVSAYLFPLSYLGLGLVAMKRSPWLATIGIACGLAGSLGWFLAAGQVVQTYNMAQIGNTPVYLALGRLTTSEWITIVYFIFWIGGHLLGYVLLGIALGRARVVPLWAACLIVAGVPFQMIAYPTRLGILQVLGFALVFIGSIPAALAMLKFRDRV